MTEAACKTGGIALAKKIFRVSVHTATVIFFVCALLFLTAAVYLRVGGGRGASVLGFSFFEVLTDSMEPDIFVGELVVVRRTAYYDLSVGDVITFWDGGKINTHRIVCINDSTVTTRGTNAAANDAPVAFDDIIGRVVANSPALGGFVGFLTSLQGLLLLLIVPAIVLLLYESWRIGTKLKEINRRPSEAAAEQKPNIAALKAELAELQEKLKQ